MDKNVKRIFFVVTLLTLLIAVSAVSANDVSDDTAVLEDTSHTTTPEEVATNTVSDDKIVDTPAKNIEKEDKNIKTSTKTVEVNNWNELQTAINTATEDSENDEYIINLNDGTYKLNTRQFTFNEGSFSPNIIINGNDQTLEVKREGWSITLDNKCNITINDLTLNAELFSYVDLTLNNVIIEFANIENNGNMELNNVSSEWDIVNNEGSTLIISNSELFCDISNFEGSTLIIKNSTLNRAINNVGGNVIINDDVVFGDYFSITGGNITINDSSRLAPYLSELNGEYIIENTIIKHDITNLGNLVIRNSTTEEYFKITNQGNLIIEDSILNNEFYNYANITLENTTANTLTSNFGNLTLKNTTFNQGIANKGNLTIADDVLFGENFGIGGDGQIISNNTNLIPYLTTLNGSYTIENQFTKVSSNYGNLTIRNSTFDGGDSIDNRGNLTIECSVLDKVIRNYGNLTLKNMTANARIIQDDNYATITIANDVTIGDGFSIYSSNNRLGTVIIDDYSRIFKYMDVFEYEATVELGNWDKKVDNYGNLTIENTTFSTRLTPESLAGVINENKYSKLIIRNSTTNTKNPFSNSGIMEIYNSTINTTIANMGTLILSEDIIVGENFQITGDGVVLTNNTQILVDYVKIWEEDIALDNKTITQPKINKGTLALNNCTVNSTITNEGTIIIDDNTVFGENAKITSVGKIETNNITKLLPFIDTINGNYIITDTTLNKTYTFNGEVTLIKCTINNPDNNNFGKLTITNCTIDVGEDNTFLTNYGILNISEDSNINGKIVNLVDNGAYIVNKDTIGYFFGETGLTSIVKAGDILDIQGTIKLNQSLIVNKPVNIISTTNDGYIDLNTTAGSMFGDAPGNCFVINNEGSYTNVTGIYFHNTQLWIYNTHHVTLDNISAVVENRTVGSGVGQTSIRANSTYVTLKNSFIYTENNGGSSSVVLAWADNCIIENNTIQGVGYVGNLLYLTYFNVDIPGGLRPNCNNQLLNNILIGPEGSSAICVAIMLSGSNNTIGNNSIYYVGGGIGGQWSSEEGYTDTSNNTFFNNTQKYGQPEIELIVDTTEFTSGETATIKASLYYTNKVQTDINKGKVTFKVNGKTLKDANGKVIYAKVVNGTATIENYVVPEDWMKKGSTIQAIYSGSTDMAKLTSEKTEITVNTPETTITTTDVTATAGETVTLTATINSDLNINTGKVVFKINGKSIKDANSKVIYAKVVNNQASVEYAIPADMKAKDYQLTAVFISTDYERLEDTKTLTVI